MARGALVAGTVVGAMGMKMNSMMEKHEQSQVASFHLLPRTGLWNGPVTVSFPTERTPYVWKSSWKTNALSGT